MKIDKYDDISQESTRKSELKKNRNVISNFRIIASQCYPALAIVLLKITNGGFIGLKSFFITEMSKENGEISGTIDQISLFSSSCFMLPVGTITGGVLAQYFGCRIVFIILTLLTIVSCLIFHWATSVTMLLCGQAIIGLESGMLLSTSYSYLAEIAEPRIRSILQTSLNTATLLGTFNSSLLSNFIYWRTLVLILIVFSILSFGMVCFMPESPHWLASKNRFHEAEVSLAWFRGWTTLELIQTEFNSEFLNRRKLSFISIDPPDVRNETSKKQSRLRLALDPFMQKSFYLPLATIFCVHLVHALCGSSIIQTFAMWIFKNINSPIDEHVATTILFGVRVAGALFCMFSINFFGKKKLVFFSLIGGTTCLTVVAVFNYLANSKGLNSDIYLWISTISVTVVMFTFAAGIEKIPFILNSEIFPTKLRQISNGIGHLSNGLFTSAVNQSFLYAVAAITLPGVFLAFAIMNFIGLIVLYLILPETEGKTLKDIEELYNNTKKNERIPTSIFTKSKILNNST